MVFIPISIGNKERKHTCHNKPEKTTDSWKTLTGCGFSLFSRKIYCAAAGTKNGKRTKIGIFEKFPIVTEIRV